VIREQLVASFNLWFSIQSDSSESNPNVSYSSRQSFTLWITCRLETIIQLHKYLHRLINWHKKCSRRTANQSNEDFQEDSSILMHFYRQHTISIYCLISHLLESIDTFSVSNSVTNNIEIVWILSHTPSQSWLKGIPTESFLVLREAIKTRLEKWK
jgi:hypothetical protein